MRALPAARIAAWADGASALWASNPASPLRRSWYLGLMAALMSGAQACGVSEVPAGGAFVEKGLAGAAHRELAALREEVLVRLGREREATPAGPAANLAELQLRALAVARATVSATPLTTLRRR